MTAMSQISDPVSDTPVVDREKLEAIFADIQGHQLYEHEIHGCLNCGICTATCPSAHYYDYSPREIVQLLWTENLEGIYDAMQEKIWACAQCYTCAARCPFESSPGGLVMIMREVAPKGRSPPKNPSPPEQQYPQIRSNPKRDSPAAEWGGRAFFVAALRN